MCNSFSLVGKTWGKCATTIAMIARFFPPLLVAKGGFVDVCGPRSLLGFGNRQVTARILYGFRYLGVEACAGEQIASMIPDS